MSGDVISGENVKTKVLNAVYAVLPALVVSEMSKTFILWRRKRRRRTSTIALSENAFAFRIKMPQRSFKRKWTQLMGLCETLLDDRRLTALDDNNQFSRSRITRSSPQWWQGRSPRTPNRGVVNRRPPINNSMWGHPAAWSPLWWWPCIIDISKQIWRDRSHRYGKMLTTLHCLPFSISILLLLEFIK